jgi:hypothetical protein
MRRPRPPRGCRAIEESNCKVNYTQKLKYMNLVSLKVGAVLDRFGNKLNLLNSYKHRLPIPTEFYVALYKLFNSNTNIYQNSFMNTEHEIYEQRGGLKLSPIHAVI